MEIEMQTLEELHAHYMAVRARLNGGKPKLTLVKPVEKTPSGPYEEPAAEKNIKPIPVAVIHMPRIAIMPETPAQTILREVAEKHNMSVKQIQSASRTKAYVGARQEASYRLNTELGFSLKQIGNMLGRRDHTTILHAINRYKKNLAEDREVWSKSEV
jgi:hypothetical protein